MYFAQERPPCGGFLIQDPRLSLPADSGPLVSDMSDMSDTDNNVFSIVKARRLELTRRIQGKMRAVFCIVDNKSIISR